MMSAYIMPIKVAILTFPILAFFISLPLMIKQYRRYGSFIFMRAFILYTFIFYLLCAYFLIILPLPPREAVAQYTSQTLELRPFYTVVRFLNDTVLNIKQPNTYLPALRQGVVLEPVFNVLLLVPFGVYLRYYFNWSLKKTVVASFLLSLFFELTQLSGLYFIYPRPYRLADVNDLMNNTLGGLIGYWMAPIMEHLFPSRETIDAVSFKKGQRVTAGRRFIAFSVDWVAFEFFYTLTTSLLITANIPHSQNLVSLMSKQPYLKLALGVFIVFIFIPTFTNGVTLGKAFLKIKVTTEKGTRASFWSLLYRYVLLYAIPLIGSAYNQLFSYLFGETGASQMTLRTSYIYVGLFLFITIAVLIWFLSLFLSLFKKQQQLYYERLSHTIEVSTLKTPSEHD